MRRNLGFTLLEMMLAVTVIAVAGIAISRAVGGVAGQSYTLERRTMAHWVAQNQVNRLRIARHAQADEALDRLKELEYKKKGGEIDPDALVKAAQNNPAKLRELLNSGKARVRK